LQKQHLTKSKKEIKEKRGTVDIGGASSGNGKSQRASLMSATSNA